MAKASYEVLVPSKRSSFLVNQFNRDGFMAPFHYHPEYELTLILEGNGKRFIGNSMNSFDKMDLVLVGSNLPHCWKLSESKKSNAKSLVIQIPLQFVENHITKAPEFKNIQKLLVKSAGGVRFGYNTANYLKTDLLNILNEKNEFEKLILLLKVLHSLSTSKDGLIINKNVATEPSDNNREKINKVFAYIVENFQQKISLNTVSDLVNMTPNAFCKYFKKNNQKTFMDTVIDYRINYATQLLIDSEKSIAEVCFESGFTDLSHFYKVFNSRMEMTPLQYRKKYLQETV